MAAGFSMPDLGLSFGPGARVLYADPSLRMEPQDPVAAEEATLTRLLEVSTRAHGPQDQRTLMARYNLASFYAEHGTELSAAEVARLNRENGGPGAMHSGLITPFKAESHARLAFTGRLRLLGEAHDETLDAAALMASLFVRAGRYQEALGLLEQVARQKRQRHGLASGETLAALSQLGSLYQHMACLEEAEAVFRDVAAAVPAVYGENSDAVHNARGNHGQALLSLDRAAEAEPILREVLRGLRASPNKQHTDALVCAGALGVALGKRGAHAEAVALVREARDAWVAAERASSAPGSTSWRNHPEYMRSKYTLALLERDAGNADEAEVLFREALAEYDATLGRMHPDTGSVAFQLGSLLKADGRVAEAKKLLARAAQADAAAQGKDHPYAQSSAQQAAEARAEAATCSFPDCKRVGGADVVIKRCAACLAAGYCSPECQKADWKAHKSKCKRLAEKRQNAAK